MAAHAAERRDRRVAAGAARPGHRPGDERHPPAAPRAVDDPIAGPRGQRVARNARPPLRHLVGHTPPEYLTRWRMDLAAQRLRDTDDTVAPIADAVRRRTRSGRSAA